MSKKWIFILSLVIAFSLVLAACQPAAVEQPAAEEPSLEEPVVVVEEPAG